MSTRYRPPRPRSSPYITKEGAATLRKELEQLWTVERPKVTQEVADAAAQGDRSENAEYTYGKKRLREIDRRVRFLSKRLEQVKVVTDAPSDANKVFFGAWVTIEDEDGELARYRIVGADEFSMPKRWISMDSPLAKGLMGKRLGDAVVITRPKGEMEVVIVKIEYDAAS